ncbi:uncharacterized protein [Henckelia pumila]|uniref:uncharacterized protein n=1 Tax=Henckelia pumila TaxID=405737 RepID=UPI003C6EA460
MSLKPLIGGETPGVAEDSIERLENFFREYQCTEEQRMESLGFLLEGNSKKWWRTVSTTIIAARGVATWVEFRAAFEKLYFPPALLHLKANELLSLRQGTMNIDKYQQKFIELLPYCSQFVGSTTMQYTIFLQGPNPEIQQMVSVGGDLTYEDLVSRCHQEENSIRRNRSMGSSSRPTSSLGPKGQSFKKQGGTSSSSSRFYGVHRFRGQKWNLCQQCRRRLPAGQCPRVTSACFQCGQEGHLKRDFPTLMGAAGGSLDTHASVQQQQQQHSQQQRQKSQPSPQQTSTRGHSLLQPRVKGQVFALNQEQAEADSDRMIVGTCTLCGISAFVLIDTGASHSFISARFSKRHSLPYIPIDVLLVVSTPMGQEVWANNLVMCCILDFEGHQLSANLMVLAMKDFDCIIGIDLLTTYRAIVDCYQRFVQFRLEDGDMGYFYDEIPGLPSVREIDSGIELLSGTTPIFGAPYQLAPLEMKELQKQLQAELNMRQLCWMVLLKDYNCEIKYHTGSSKPVANALNRKVYVSSLRTSSVAPVVEECCSLGFNFQHKKEQQGVCVLSVLAEPALYTRIREL